MHKAAKGAFLGCGGVLVLLGIAIVALVVFSGPGEATPHKFDAFRKDPDTCINAFDGSGGPNFSHIWVLRSPDLNAWWGPNGLRAEADLILDSDDPEIIRSLLTCTGSASRSSNSVRLLSKGRIYHVLLFDELRSVYAHLRFSYRSQQSNGATLFNVVTDFNGATPVKDCRDFSDFEKRWLASENDG